MATVGWWADVRGQGLDPPIDFTLQISETKTAPRYGGTVVDTEVQRIGVYWQEYYRDRWRLGLRGGYSFVTQTGNAATAGLELDGYHAAVAFDVDLIQRPRFKWYAGGAYFYERTNEETSGQRITLSWHAPTGRIGAVVGLAGGVSLHAGVQHGYIAGQERLHGTVNQTTGVARPHDTGGFVGLELSLDADGGYAGISGQSGVERGAALYFGRRYR